MATKVLIVLDGEYRFQEPTVVDDFTFTTLVDTLSSAGMDVTRAHRDLIGADAVTNGETDIQEFNFATSVDLLDFDVIWLIGHHGRNGLPPDNSPSGNHLLEEAELDALTKFMDAGGGVFATGDHDSIGADMCGHLPRVRVMRAWFGDGDGASTLPNSFPRNFPSVTSDRADTVQPSPKSDYDLNNDGMDENHVYFENQSDSIPQPITAMTTPTHPILLKDGGDIVVYPDHMHEGQTLGQTDIPESFYELPLPAGVSNAFVEFPTVDIPRELPKVIAQGLVLEHSQRYGDHRDSPVVDSAVAIEKPVNTLTVYDGRKAGVGRIVTGSTFHHYIDINLLGDSDIDNVGDPDEIARVGDDAVKGEGFAYAGAEQIFEDIKQVYVNITNWLTRPRPRIDLILERSTFSSDEVDPGTSFDGVILVTVDGLKPNQFPGGPLDDLTPNASDLQNWAPSIELTGISGIEITPISVDSDLPSLPDKLQRFTFTYRITFNNEDDFGFNTEFKNFKIEATLNSAAAANSLKDDAWIQLINSGNPFMLDLANGNSTTWLSSDVRVFPVVAGSSRFGITLPDNATKAQAYSFLQDVIGSMSAADFESLDMSQAESALSPFPKTTESDRNVYNFAIARVRLDGNVAAADQVRVYFRIFNSQTTAALSYKFLDPNEPLEGYKRTDTANPIALPGVTSSGNEWLSFPFFAESRSGSPDSQVDGNNVNDMIPSPGQEVITFFGALIDNNLNEDYLPSTPNSGGGNQSISNLLMGEHQCLVAQIQYSSTPIPNGSKPSNSDKLSQRNIAFSSIANPGTNASRMALHTFEIEATPSPITEKILPDELMMEWETTVPEGTYVKIYIPSWDTAKVMQLADRFYPEHTLEVEDEHTILLPYGGTSYIPIPRNLNRQTGVVSAHFPLGIKKGQRYDLRFRQITTETRRVKVDPVSSTVISLREAEKIIQGLNINDETNVPKTAGLKKTKNRKRGSYDLGDNKILYTDLSVFNMANDHAIIYEGPDPEAVAAARRESGIWRETIGAFQMGIPVSVKNDMLPHYLRLLSLLLWRLEHLPRKSRWFKTFSHYVDLIIKKVQALGGNPFVVPATPDGSIDLTGINDDGENPKPDDGPKPGDDIPGEDVGNDDEEGFFEPKDDDWLNETNGLDVSKPVKAYMISGKVSGLLFDHFGDFEGFTLELYNGNNVRLFSREYDILKIAKKAWSRRYVVTAMTVSKKSRRIRRLLVRGYSDQQ